MKTFPIPTKDTVHSAMSYEIENITPFIGGYELDENGKYIIPRDENDVLILNYEYCVPAVVGKGSTIRLLDERRTRLEDWEDMHNEFYLQFKDGSKTHIYPVSGSETSVIAGANHYTTAQQLASKKKYHLKEKISEETGYKFDIGHALEEIIAKGFHEKTGKKVVKDNSVFFNVSTGFMMANIDFFVAEEDGTLSILEIKTTTAASLWADNDVPFYYKTQALYHYPFCLEDLNINKVYFCCMFDTDMSHLIIRSFDRIPELENWLYLKEAEFVGYVDSDEIIPHSAFDDTPEAVERLLAKLYPKADPEKKILIKNNAEFLKAASSYKAIYDEKSALEKQARALSSSLTEEKNTILEFMQDASTLTFTLNNEEYCFTYPNGKEKISFPADKLSKFRLAKPEMFNALVKDGYISIDTPRGRFSLKKGKKPKTKAPKIQPKKSSEQMMLLEEV